MRDRNLPGQAHIDRAELHLEELEEQWHVGEPHQRILLAQTHALIAIAELLATEPETTEPETTEPETTEPETIDVDATDPHVYGHPVWLPDEAQMMAARGAIFSIVCSIENGNVTTRPAVLDQIIKSVVLSLRGQAEPVEQIPRPGAYCAAWGPAGLCTLRLGHAGEHHNVLSSVAWGGE